MDIRIISKPFPKLKLPIWQDIDKSGTEINRRKVQIETGEKMIKKLMKGIEESKKERERLIAEKESLLATFKEIEQKAFTVQENYKKIQEVVHKFSWTFAILFGCLKILIPFSFASHVMHEAFFTKLHVFSVIIMQLIDQHKGVLDEAKSDYEKLKKTVDELRASEVCAARFLVCWLIL